MKRPSLDPKAMTEGAAAYSKVVTIASEMVVPGLIGLWIDHQFGTGPVAAVSGFVLGMILCVWHLMKMALTPPRQSRRQGQSEDHVDTSPHTDSPEADQNRNR